VRAAARASLGTVPAFPRSSGVILHPTSLPSGRLGREAHGFADWLADAGQTWWQMLPLGPPDRHGSPYKAKSAFAASPALLAEPRARVTKEQELDFRERERYWIEDWARLGGRGAQALQLGFREALQIFERCCDDAALEAGVCQAREQPRGEPTALGARLLRCDARRLGPVPLLERPVLLPLLIERFAQRRKPPNPLGVDFLLQPGAARLLLLRPVGETAFVLLLERSGLGLCRSGLRERLLDPRLARLDRLLHRPVEEPLQDPDEREEVQDLERECGPVELHVTTSPGIRAAGCGTG